MPNVCYHEIHLEWKSGENACETTDDWRCRFHVKAEQEAGVSYHGLGALYQSLHRARQVGVFGWSVSEHKDLRGGRSRRQSQLAGPDVRRKGPTCK